MVKILDCVFIFFYVFLTNEYTFGHMPRPTQSSMEVERRRSQHGWLTLPYNVWLGK